MTADLGARLERLELNLLPWFTRAEEQAAASGAAVEARLEMLESRLTAAHDASVEAVGLLAGHLAARLEEQVAGIESAIEARHQRLVAHVEASMTERHTELLTTLEADRNATMEALGGLAPVQRVDQLLEGVVALGEVLDAELMNLRQLINPGALAATDAPGAGRRSAQPDLPVDGPDGRGAGDQGDPGVREGPP